MQVLHGALVPQTKHLRLNSTSSLNASRRIDDIASILVAEVTMNPFFESYFRSAALSLINTSFPMNGSLNHSPIGIFNFS